MEKTEEKKRSYLSIVLSLLLLSGGLGLVWYLSNYPRRCVECEEEDSFSFFSRRLIEPSRAQVEDLDTAEIQVFAYYNESTNWILNDTVPAFHTYTDEGNYYDGTIRVYQNARGDDFRGTSSVQYVTVHARVRADGYVMAWLNCSPSTIDRHYRGNLVYWGQTRRHPIASVITAASCQSEIFPPENSTTLSRAIEYVYHVAGKTFCGHSAINYYDYEHTEADKLFIFGEVFCDDTGTGTEYEYFTFTVTDNPEIVVYECDLSYAGSVRGRSAGGPFESRIRIYYDNTLVFSESDERGYTGPSTDTGWWIETGYPVTRGVQHEIRLEVMKESGLRTYGVIKCAVVLELG